MARDEMQLEQIGMIPEGIWISCGYNRRFGSHWSRIRRRGGRLDINEQNINYCGPSGNYDRTVELSMVTVVFQKLRVVFAFAAITFPFQNELTKSPESFLLLDELAREIPPYA